MKLRNRNIHYRKHDEDLYQLNQFTSKMPIIKSDKISQSLESKSPTHQNVKIIKQSSPDTKYTNSKTPIVLVSILNPQDINQTFNAYCDLINSEQDLFVLYDSFPIILNSLKQLHHTYTKQYPQSANSNQSSKDTIDWWKRNPDSQWSGIKNIIRLTKDKKEDSFLQNPDSNTTKSNNQNPFYSNASNLINKLKKEIGELTEEQKINSQNRQIQGKSIVVPYFDLEYLKNLLIQNNKTLLTIYHQPNKHFKSHLGFCQYSLINNECRIKKLFIGRFFRREVYLHSIVNQLIGFFYKLNVAKIKIQINSGQNELIKILYNYGAILLKEAILMANLKIFTLCLTMYK